MPRTIAVTTKVPTAIVAAVDRAAKRRGWSRSQWVAQTILRALEMEAKDSPAIKRLVAPYQEWP